MSLSTTLLYDILSFYEGSDVPLALVFTSPGVRLACEERGMVQVGSWGLCLASDGSRRVMWQPSVPILRHRVAGEMCAVVWWCNRPTPAFCEVRPVCLDLSAACRLYRFDASVAFLFHSLVELTLRCATIKDVNLLGRLPALRKLDLVQAQVVDSGIIGLKESRSLVDVDLWGCAALTNVSPLGKVPTLRRLVLAETHVCDDGLAGLVDSLCLDEVNLEMCVLVKSVGFFGRLRTLRKLTLVATSVDNKGIIGLGSSMSLVEIDLWGCSAVDDVNSLGMIPTLRKLHLFGTSVTNEGIRGLRRSSSLEEIDLTLCEAVTEAETLSKIPTLRHIVLLHTSIHDVSELLLKEVRVII
ncbi:putative leucine-rich repeat protein [Trypanosoma rangeli]|uniref:Putative leucine-rich repeat protein n=1 Tax=Trypanosoma rangeli TaxID=5698 RepID=A0A3R7NLZ7_TRYRA|nr:putative leucine-rich repeat protein [Trypanosoma rangeli]RNF04645.1 putative leucine-rich repeat protein [Trypanosoma rangeli]|eukprot:RNF04645.1 putative leucine-rich repeat protein [Trypanosoma rangeli]